MSKTKRIKLLKEFIELEKKKKEPNQKYIDWVNEEITKLENYLKKRSAKSRSISPINYVKQTKT